MSRSFVHLHCHSHYSLLDGASPIEGLIDKAKKSGMNAMAITDHGNLYGALEFYQKARRPASTRSSATRRTSRPAAASSKKRGRPIKRRAIT